MTAGRFIAIGALVGGLAAACSAGQDGSEAVGDVQSKVSNYAACGTAAENQLGQQQAHKMFRYLIGAGAAALPTALQNPTAGTACGRVRGALDLLRGKLQAPPVTFTQPDGTITTPSQDPPFASSACGRNYKVYDFWFAAPCSNVNTAYPKCGSTDIYQVAATLLGNSDIATCLSPQAAMYTQVGGSITSVYVNSSPGRDVLQFAIDPEPATLNTGNSLGANGATASATGVNSPGTQYTMSKWYGTGTTPVWSAGNINGVACQNYVGLPCAWTNKSAGQQNDGFLKTQVTRTGVTQCSCQ